MISQWHDRRKPERCFKWSHQLLVDSADGSPSNNARSPLRAAIGGCNKDKGDAVTAAFKEGQAFMLDLMAKMNSLNKP